MRRIVLGKVIAAALTLAVSQSVDAQRPGRNAPGSQAASERGDQPRSDETELASAHVADEDAIRENVGLFVKAYNERNAAAVAALFAPDAQILTEHGGTAAGRVAIEEAFAANFAETPKAQFEVSVESIHFIGDDIGIEIGATKETPAPGETPEYGRYTVLHLKRDGKWLMAAARDSAGEEPTNHEKLLPLSWMLGEWIDDGGSSVVRTNCRWSEDGNFLMQEMRIQIAGRDAMQVTQRIGWDPVAKSIRSWVFDTEGGFSDGIWTRVDDSWVIKSTGVRPDGAIASATSVLVPTGATGYIWRMRDRIVGGEALSPLEVKVVRNPPSFE